MKHRFLLVILLSVTPLVQNAYAADPSGREASADADWQTVLDLESGPQGAVKSREEARLLALGFLDKQEAALRAFITRYLDDPRNFDAQIRLAHLWVTRSDMTGSNAPYEAAVQLMDRALKLAPESKKADVVYARIAMAMRRITIPTDKDRGEITSEAIRFQHQFPNDRRVALLLVEAATLFDELPNRKLALLKQAMQSAKSDEVRARIDDDLKRLTYLGKPVPVRGETADGAKVDVADFRGKVVLVYFFAEWSPPSLAALQEVRYLRSIFTKDQLQVVGISLDLTREALQTALTSKLPGVEAPVDGGEAGFGPVIWDGKGWGGPLVRQLAINSLPTLWVLDRSGNLRTLNARTDSEPLVRKLLAEKAP